MVAMIRRAAVALCVLASSSPLHAAEFVFPEDPCATAPAPAAPPRQGGSGSLFSTSAWAEGGACLPFGLPAVWAASRVEAMMVWGGVTRLVGVTPLAVDGFPAGTIHRVRVDYEARHRHFGFCRAAQWPLEWRHRVLRGPAAAPEQVELRFERVPGGNGDGSYIKAWSGRIELTARGPDRASVHMRYEVTAPGQAPDWAAAAVTGYLDRLSRQTAGSHVHGAVPDPNCP